MEASDKASGAGAKTNEAIAAIQKDYQENKDAVIKMLIGNVMNVNIEIPRVIKGNFDDK